MTDVRESPSAADQAIGARVRLIRRRRGLSLDEAAGLAGIGKSYLSKLETGRRRFIRRGLIEDVAQALSCSVADLTGQPYLPVDRRTADALATLPGISIALHECSLSDVSDIATRSVAELAALAAEANRNVDDARYSVAGRGLGDVLTELHVHAVTGDSNTRSEALVALVEASMSAAGIARQLGNVELAMNAARRAADAAGETERPDLAAFAAMTRAGALVRLGARRRAGVLLTDALSDAQRHADPTAADSSAAEGYGMLHLSSAQLAARQGRAADAETHLEQAREMAERTGERNSYRFHFGPANVAAWSLAIAVELENGSDLADSLDTSPATFAALDSADRRAGFHLDLARAYAQAGGDRDGDAVRHLDDADRIAPTRLRSDPIARDLVADLDRRARRRVWELDSLKRRLGVA